MGEERRKSVRIKKLLTVRYSYSLDKDEKKWDMTVIKDISETGMSVTTHRPFSPNEIMTFLIKIPTRPLEWIEFTGRVVGSEELKAISGESVRGAHITRIEFINLKEDQEELIREYITWFLSKEGGKQK
jgi:c-di-GMP-binding flagellar brake protein YcgR